MGPGNLDGPHCRLIFDNPTECSGPPHLLGPWGSAGSGAVRVASSWPRCRPATLAEWCGALIHTAIEGNKALAGPPHGATNSSMLSLRDEPWLCATGAAFFFGRCYALLRG